MANKNMDAKISLPNNFTPASEKSSIKASDNIITAFSKTAKYLNDLGSAAYTDSSSYAANIHNQASNSINAMTGYSKPSTTSAINSTDTLNEAIGKLEKALDSTISANNGCLTIQRNGANVATFYADQATDTIANISVPTKTSDLTNDSGYITSAVRYDTNTQGLNATQKSNARTNIGAGTSSLTLGNAATNAYYGDKGKIAYDHATTTATNPHGTTKSDVGLGNVENKSSATIRSEITSSNVTNALDYTPVNKAGDAMTGTLQFKDNNGNVVGDIQGSNDNDDTLVIHGGETVDGILELDSPLIELLCSLTEVSGELQLDSVYRPSTSDNDEWNVLGRVIHSDDIDRTGRVVKLNGSDIVTSDRIISGLGYTPVNKAGDTVTGDVIANAAQFQVKSTNINRDGTLPSSNITGNGALRLIDKDDEGLGTISVQYLTDGNTFVYLQAFNEKSDGTQVSNYIGVSVDRNGTRTYNIADPTVFRTTISAASSNHTHNELTNKSLTDTTISNTAGTFAFSGASSSSGMFPGCDWVGLQIGDSSDKFQICTGNAAVAGLQFRRNDNGGTDTNWSEWYTFLSSGNYTTYCTPANIGAAPSGHTHTTSLATDSGTASITLAHNTTYKLTAGGTSVIFKTPTDNNTNYYHTTGSWSGLTYTATANGGAGALAFTIPTGTTSTTVAAGNHGHTDLGLNGYCRTITDWNSATTNGWYMASSASNAPETTSGLWWFGRTIAHNNKYIFQEAWQFTYSAYADRTKRYTRFCNNGTWGSWVRDTVGLWYGGKYYQGRDNACLVKKHTTNDSYYNPVIDCMNNIGDWSIGTLSSSTDNILYFVYTTNNNYNSGVANPNTLRYKLEGTSSDSENSAYTIITTKNYSSYCVPYTGATTAISSNSSITATAFTASSGTFTASNMTTGTGTNAVVTSAGAIVKQSSSRKVKHNINYIETSEYSKYYDAIMNMKPATFIYNSDENNVTKLGMIAEDVNDVCSIASMEEYKPIYAEKENENDENKIIGYNKTGEIENYDDRAIISMLIMTVQEQAKQIKELKEEINSLKSNN